MSWRPIENTVLLAFGGRKADNSLNRDVYLSRDLGMHWKKGDEFLQLPKYMPSFYDVDILQFEHLLTPKARTLGGGWTVMPTNEPFYLAPVLQCYRLRGIVRSCICSAETARTAVCTMWCGVGWLTISLSDLLSDLKLMI